MIFWTLVTLTTLGVNGLIGFYLWFVFPVETINNLTYLQTSHLIIYYNIINFMSIVGVIVFSQILYYRRVKTADPKKDGIILGAYLIVFSWIVDIIVYIFIRKTLPTLHEYFLGKNQPEIGIAWLVGFFACVLAGVWEAQRRSFPDRSNWKRMILYPSILMCVSFILILVGILYFDIRP
ncbi:hypothetical protein EH221_12485 [bacterium]|nr:MAG: hypothetical protein EH221_12485 [bacterium]